MNLSQFDIDILHALAKGETPTVGAGHRLRLELLGLTRDTAQGLQVTRAGIAASRTSPTVEHEKVELPPRRLDAAGRKRMHERKLEI